MTTHAEKQEAQKKNIQFELEIIEKEIVMIISQRIVWLHQAAMDRGIPAELVTTQIDEYRKNLPEIKLEVLLDHLPPKALRQ